MKWFTSDTHFGHKNIIKYSNRPFKDFFHMDAQIVENWNTLVHPEDEVYHLGDVALGPWERWDEILRSLNGFKILVVGNHDRIFRGEKPRMQERFAEHYADWFDVVTDEIKNFPVAGKLVNMSHFPYDGDSHDGDRYTQYRLPDDGKILIHGHTHAEYAQTGMDSRVSRSKAGTLQVHVGMDAWDYNPVSEDQIDTIFREFA